MQTNLCFGKSFLYYFQDFFILQTEHFCSVCMCWIFFYFPEKYYAQLNLKFGHIKCKEELRMCFVAPECVLAVWLLVKICMIKKSMPGLSWISSHPSLLPTASSGVTQHAAITSSVICRSTALEPTFP
jgi:hypothetical protein